MLLMDGFLSIFEHTNPFNHVLECVHLSSFLKFFQCPKGIMKWVFLLHLAKTDFLLDAANLSFPNVMQAAHT